MTMDTDFQPTSAIYKFGQLMPPFSSKRKIKHLFNKGCLHALKRFQSFGQFPVTIGRYFNQNVSNLFFLCVFLGLTACFRFVILSACF